MTSGDMLKRRYRLVRQIGSGTFATVYLAQDLTSHEYYAVKVIDKKWFNDESMFERFAREVELGMQLRHNHIAKVLSYGKTEAGYYIVMEWIQGITLREYLKKKPELSNDEAISITQQILSALAYAYHHGVTVHRDLKPENIMIEAKTGRVIVLDFGIAQIQGSNITKSHRLFSLRYAAPEQLSESSKPLNHTTDLYAVGVILYEMLTKRPPFLGRSITELYDQEMKKQIINPNKLNPDLNSSWKDFFEVALDPDPKKRFQTPIQMNDSLKPFIKNAVQKKQTPSTSAKISKNVVIVGISFVVLFFLMIYFVFASSWWENTSFHQDSINHRLSFSSPFAISLKLFLNDDMNTDISPQLEIRKKDNNKKIEIYKLREKERKGALDFKSNDELTLLIEDEAKNFEPITLVLTYTIDKEGRILWTTKDNKILIAEEERVLANIAITKKILNLSDSSFWIPVKYLKIKAEGAEKVELFSNNKNLFGSNLEPPQYATDFTQNKYARYNVKKEIKYILSGSSTSPSVLTCYIHYPDAKYAFDLLYQGVNDGYQHEWSCNGEVTDITDPNQKKKVEYISIEIQKGDQTYPYYPTLIIQKLKGTVTFQVKEKTGKRSVSNANITIQQDGVNKGSAILKEGSASFTLFVGKYQYKIVDDGYKDIEGTFDVKANETTSITKELEEKPKPPPLLEKGKVVFYIIDVITRQPIIKALITIQDIYSQEIVFLDYTNDFGEISSPLLKYGLYQYKIKIEGYEDIIGTFQVNQDSKTIHTELHSIKSQPNFRMIQFYVIDQDKKPINDVNIIFYNSNGTKIPGGERTTINGMFQIELLDGNYQYIIDDPRYEKIVESFSTTDKLPIRIILTYKDKETSILIITTKPNGAEIYIDGILIGLSTSFGDGFEVTIGYHKLLIKMEGYEDYTETIKIELGNNFFSKTLTKKIH